MTASIGHCDLSTLPPKDWCRAADAFADGDVELKNIDHKLKGQLTTPTSDFRNCKILIESKAEIKKRLGNSPDQADAYVNGLYEQ